MDEIRCWNGQYVFVHAAQSLNNDESRWIGAESLATFLRGMAEAGSPMVCTYVFRILARGNFAVSCCLAQIGDEDYAVFDLFRLQDGLIVEH